MASGYQNTMPEDSHITSSGVRLFDYGLLQEAASSTTIDSVSLPQRYSNLDEFSEQLERETQKTRRLQEVMENATKRTMERIGHSFTPKSTSLQLGYMPVFPMTGSSEDNSDTLSSCRQSVIQPLNYGLDGDGVDPRVAKSGASFPGKDVFEKPIEDFSQQVSELQKQLSEKHEQHEQFIFNLQSKLQELQREKVCITDLRLKESRKHADLMGEKQAMITELQAIKQNDDQRLLEAEDEAKSLSMKAHSMERTIQDVYCALLAYEKRFGYISYVSGDVAGAGQSSLGVAVEKVLQDLECESRNLREKLLLAETQLGSQEQKCQEKAEMMMKEQRERLEQLNTSRDQEVAMLTEKLESSRTSASSLRVQVELLQRQAESQASMHQNEVSDLESALTILRSDLLDAQRGHEVKLEALEKQLAQTQSQVEEAQRGRDRFLQQAEELDAQLCQLTSERRQAREELSLEKQQNKQLWERDAGRGATIDGLRRDLEERSLGVQQLEALVGSLKEEQAQTEAQLRDELSVLRGELALTRDQLQRGRAEEPRLRALAEEREAAGERLRTQLDERERELQLEAQQGRARLEEAQGRCQALRAEAEAKSLELEDREKTAEVLRRRMESAARLAAKRGRSVDSLRDEKSRLGSQLDEQQLEIQQLRGEVDQRQARLAALETERRQQQTSLSEQSCRVRELTLENRQLTAELEAQSTQLLSLTEEQEELRKLHSSRSREHEGVVTKLRSQLKTTRAELDQARIMEGADGHGMKVAMGMQKQITAKRDQVDSLQGRIQLLEETLEKLSQDKRHQNRETKRQFQELASAREEKRRLAEEVKTLRSLERCLRDKVTKLETALHKMTESFADCQDHIQMQEQEFMRLKLQHALDLKELQGQSLRSTGGAAQRVSVSSPTALDALPSSALPGSKCLLELGPQKRKESPTLQLRSVVLELRGVISENPGSPPPTLTSPSYSSSRNRRRSVPERVFAGTTLNEVTKDVTIDDKVSKETYSIRPHLLRTTDLEGRNERNLNGTFSSESELISFKCHGGTTTSNRTSSYEASSAAFLPCYMPPPQAVELGCRSPVHSLLTSDPNNTPPPQNRPEAAGPLTDKHTLVNPQAELTTHNKGLQGKLDNLQNMVEDLQMKNQEMYSTIKGQERRVMRVKDKGRLYNKQSTE